jgi:cytidine deaminase
MSDQHESFARLKAMAMEACGNAYSPYSRFSVGAAVIDADGHAFAGCNVENASYGMTQCAERNAIGAAIAGGSSPGSLVTLVIYTPGDTMHPPCGACRQVMHEMMTDESRVISCCDSDGFRAWTRHEHLPDAFVFPEIR